MHGWTGGGLETEWYRPAATSASGRLDLGHLPTRHRASPRPLDRDLYGAWCRLTRELSLVVAVACSCLMAVSPGRPALSARLRTPVDREPSANCVCGDGRSGMVVFHAALRSERS